MSYHARLPLCVPGVVSAAQRGVSTGKTTDLLESARRYTAQLPGGPSEEPGGWDASSVTALDAVETRYAQRGKKATMIRLNKPSADTHERLAGHLTGSH